MSSEFLSLWAREYFEDDVTCDFCRKYFISFSIKLKIIKWQFFRTSPNRLPIVGVGYCCYRCQITHKILLQPAPKKRRENMNIKHESVMIFMCLLSTAFEAFIFFFGEKGFWTSTICKQPRNAKAFHHAPHHLTFFSWITAHCIWIRRSQFESN